MNMTTSLKALIRKALIGCGCLSGSLLSASVVTQFDFNDDAGTQLEFTSPSVGNNWNALGNISVTDGSGNLETAGAYSSTVTTPLTSSIDSSSVSDIYELVYSGVTFQNLSGNDYMVFAYRESQSGTPLPGSSTTRAWMKFGDFAGTQGSLDIEAGPDANNTQRSGTDLISTSNTFDFIARWDMGNDNLQFFYDAGSGRVQVGSDLASVNGTISHIGMYANITDSGSGDTISIDGISLTVIPEPGTLALVGIALGSLLLFRRKR